MEENINSSLNSLLSLFQYNIFFYFITKYKTKRIGEIYDKKFLNTITIGGLIIVIYVMFFEDYFINIIKKTNLKYKQIILYSFILYSTLYIILLKNDEKYKKSLYITPTSYKNRKSIIEQSIV